MKKVFGFLVLFVSLLVLGISSSEEAMRWLAQARYQETGALGSDKYRFGDLYGLSYLPDFRIEHDTALISNQVKSTRSRDTDLYILGDSYLYSYIQMDSSNFERTKQLVFRKWSDGDKSPLVIRASKNKKILLIESVERNVWTVIDLLRVKAHLEGYKTPLSWDESLNATLTQALYHPSLEQNIDFTLFNFQTWSPVKSWKAQWNLTVFGRTDQAVVLSKDRQFLYMQETMDSLQRGSSFYPTSQSEITALFARMVTIEKYAIAHGFDEVVFSFIPNPVAITQTEGRLSNQLNQKLLAQIQGSLHFIDPTNGLLKGGKQYFYQSDSHWNQLGAKVWLKQLNEYLLTP